jgi:hypothetical protein
MRTYVGFPLFFHRAWIRSGRITASFPCKAFKVNSRVASFEYSSVVFDSKNGCWLMSAPVPAPWQIVPSTAYYQKKESI